MRVDQLLAGFADGDAISTEALLLQAALRTRGVTSEIFADLRHVSPSLRAACRPLADYAGTPADVALHHYSIGSDALRRFSETPARRVLRYHNITPAECFDGFDDRVAAQLRDARAQLPAVAAGCAAILAVSRYNAAELESLGLRNVRVLPLLFSAAPFDQPDRPEVARRVAPPLTTLLFVGRIAPNKKVETLIETFYWYQRIHNPCSRLTIVGSEHSCPRYFAMLRMQASDLDLTNVCFEGFAAPEGLPTYYRHAAAFITTSEHEGYCLPLLEAMHNGVPVIARAQGGMPEALGGAGVQFEGLRPAELAGLVHRVVSDAPLRAEIVASQRVRMQEIAGRDVAAEMAQLLDALRSP